ncbi:high affinity cGMP-specific 3',5'-cyclic phosphodiesterase 9A [Drosophila willistoni]|uniref:high affinity cGMP-specific 3',5'-cyclic phosphodiesterase 9A n=1 Tax=Drosophila willistoni TaxID=7260 RepID=UPI00017D6403|nr:high affinity cGMP-specific 3',5'-cyclic phosphodiesterase 9A [Drosophila willistoni]
MYQDSGCSSSSSRRGSSAAATSAAAAAAATATATATATTSSKDEKPLETLTIITTTTITETEINAAATTTTVIAATTTTTAAATTIAAAEVLTSDAEAETSQSSAPAPAPQAKPISAPIPLYSAPQRQQYNNAPSYLPPVSVPVVAAASAALSADVRLLRKIGYIASRVRRLAKFYGDFRLKNPYSARRQRRQLQEIILKHSIFDPGKERERALLLAAAAVAVGAALPGPTSTTVAAVSITGSINSASGSNRSLSIEREEEEEVEAEEEDDFDEANSIATGVVGADDIIHRVDQVEVAIATTTTATTTATATTVLRKSSTSSTAASATPTASGSVSFSASASINTSSSIGLLEELLIQFYEDQFQAEHQHRSNLTVIHRQHQHQQQQNHHFVTSDSRNNNNHNNNNNGFALTMSTSLSNMTADDSQQQQQQQQQLPTSSSSSTVVGAFLQPISLSDAATGNDNPRRRRASDCSAALSNQLHCITLKNNNCATTTATTSGSNNTVSTTGNLPFHRGSCGAAGEHLLAANSIANRATIILSKSCNNVDGDSNAMGIGIGGIGIGGMSHIGVTTANKLRASSTDIESNALNGARDAMATIAAAAAASNNGNGNNEYSILQLNNTIIQCHFNDDDFRALVKDLKRKVEYTERMNWLCLSKRPLGPPHRKSSLPKHQEVKRRFLEICDTNFSDEVKAALRLPAFDSYEWSDADVIHLMQTMFIELGFIEKFSIPVDTLREWLYEVYKHYNEVPFHNFRHCFCVAQMMYAITRQANLLTRIGDLECLILLVSCICHDLDHPGYNNIYQINARTELALRYNDISPLENHHCSIAFRLLEHPECNIFKNFNRDTFNTIREGIIRCILATDMARHNEILTQFMEVTPNFDYGNRAHINLLCMILIKVADISNEARPMDVAEPWLDRLLQEFFAQSAAEKSEGLPVTPFMDPDKVSKPGSQVRFIGLVLLPLFEALGELVPELTELIIIPVRIALEYYRRLNDAQTKTRKSVADSNTSDSNSGTMDSNAALVSTPGNDKTTMTLDKSTSGGTSPAAPPGGGSGGGPTIGSASGGGNVSPQMPRSGSGISVKSRRSIPSQKSASRTSVDEPGGMAAELHDLPEGSESGDSETATEVDVAEKTSKFKVDTEGSSNRSKSSHSTSRKSSREKRPSMVGELCSSGGGQRIRNSYGNIHGYHSNRCHFGNNRAVSLDQYSTSSNNRRLSDGLPQVISDSNVFYGRHNRSSLEAGAVAAAATATTTTTAMRPHEDKNANTNLKQQLTTTGAIELVAAAVATSSSANGNISPSQQQPYQTLASNGSTRSSDSSTRTPASAVAIVGSNSSSTAGGAAGVSGSGSGSGWKSRLRQFSDYFSFSFDKGNKRFGSTRSSPCPGRANNNAAAGDVGAPAAGGGGGGGTAAGSKSGSTSSEGVGVGKFSTCCTISNAGGVSGNAGDALGTATSTHRHRAYSLDVPCSGRGGISGLTRYSSGDSSRKSSRLDDGSSNNTLHSSEAATGVVTADGVGGGTFAGTTNAAALASSLSIDMGLASVSILEAGPKI